MAHPRLLSGAALALLAAAARPAHAQTPSGGGGYHVVNTIQVGGEGGWDYLTVDTLNHHLFVSRGTHTIVVSTDSDRVVGDIPNTNGVHGIAIATDLGKGYTSNGRDSSVTVFDLRSLAVLKTVRIDATNPDAIMYEPVTHRVFTFNGRSNDATAIDASSDTPVGNVPLGAKPEFAQADGKGMVYVNLEEEVGRIVAIDARSLQKRGEWTITGCASPSGMAIDRATMRLFSGCENRKLAVTDATNGHVVTLLPIGPGVDANAFDPGTHFIFSSNGGDGTLTVFHEANGSTFHELGSTATARGARTMALDERTHRVYTVTADFGPAPAATATNPRPRPQIVAGTFRILVLSR